MQPKINEETIQIQFSNKSHNQYEQHTESERHKKASMLVRAGRNQVSKILQNRCPPGHAKVKNPPQGPWQGAKPKVEEPMEGVRSTLSQPIEPREVGGFVVATSYFIG